MADVEWEGETPSVPEYMLTTMDNPYSPFDEFNAWYAWDVAHGHKTAELLGRIGITNDELMPGDLQAAINFAIDEIVEQDDRGIFKRVARDMYSTTDVVSGAA